MGKFKVLIPQDIAEEGKKFLRDKGYEIKMGSGITVEDIKKDVVDCDAILIRTAPIPAEVIDASKKLKVIARHGVGVDNVDVERATKRGIYVTNAPESNSNTVAEHALGMIIALARNFIICDKATRNGDFEIRNRIKGIDLEEKTLGILGMGKIGKLLSKKAYYGLSMKVIGYDPFVDSNDFPEGVIKVDERDNLFKESDFISIHIPSTPETKRSIGMKDFKLMKKNAYLINVARGDIVNENELIDALVNGEIAGAGLDVYEQEPPPINHPFFKLDNVLLTPHNAALTKECMVRMALHAAQGIHEVLSGQKPTWPVNIVNK